MKGMIELIIKGTFNELACFCHRI